MNAVLNCVGKTPDDSNLLNSSVRKWRQQIYIVLQQVRWYWISGALLVWQFTDNDDDVVGLKYTESGQIAIRWRWYEVRRWSVGGGSANAGDLVVETTM